MNKKKTKQIRNRLVAALTIFSIFVLFMAIALLSIASLSCYNLRPNIPIWILGIAMIVAIVWLIASAIKMGGQK